MIFYKCTYTNPEAQEVVFYIHPDGTQFWLEDNNGYVKEYLVWVEDGNTAEEWTGN
jgi:hypothetical protein